jgi:hypothetical protein
VLVLSEALLVIANSTPSIPRFADYEHRFAEHEYEHEDGHEHEDGP